MTNDVVRRLARDPGIIIVKRGVALSKTYIFFAIFLALIAILLANMNNVLPQGISESGDFVASIWLLSVALIAFAALLLTTPVILLYVYDKNNGVLEYFLSLGLDQGDVFKRYLKAGVMLVVLLIIAAAAANGVVALILRGDMTFPLAAAGLAAALTLPIVAFSTMAMMAFSSLQKQRVGANQPLGLALGALLVMPVYIASFVLPFIVVVVTLTEAVVITVLSIALFLLSQRLISREKLLP